MSDIVISEAKRDMNADPDSIQKTLRYLTLIQRYNKKANIQDSELERRSSRQSLFYSLDDIVRFDFDSLIKRIQDIKKECEYEKLNIISMEFSLSEEQRRRHGLQINHLEEEKDEMYLKRLQKIIKRLKKEEQKRSENWKNKKDRRKRQMKNHLKNLISKAKEDGWTQELKEIVKEFG